MLRRSLLFLAILATLSATSASAQTAGTSLELRPFCSQGYSGTEWIYGPVPAPGWNVGENTDLCAPFEIRDPQTLQTTPLHKGDELALDLVIQNPGSKQISGARVWLSYDATLLTGKEIVVNQELFPEIIPGEADFASKNGYVKIHVNASDKSMPTSYWVHIATIRFTVEKEVSPGTVLSFFDVQRDGHTYVLAMEGGKETSVLTQEPGSLFIQLAPSSAGTDGTPATEGTEDATSSDASLSASGSTLLDAGAPCADGASCASGTCEAGVCTAPVAQPLTACSFDGECPSGTCYENACQLSGFLIPDGGDCRRDEQCASEVCRDGACSGTRNLPDGTGCTSSLECASNHCENSVCMPATSCFEDTDCPENNVCSDGICSPKQSQIPVGGTCVLSTQCLSSLCVEGVCQDQLTYQNDKTAFSLLQVQNLRVTSENTTAFLKWDPLRSSTLKAYNVYYSATSGQYIQRKTVPPLTPSITIRNLPEKQTYYFAVRAVNMEDEESAFSQEVAVEIGNPSTSTAPLIASISTDAPGENPVVTGDAGTLPGETGMGTIAAILLLISAAVGTVLAARRQLRTSVAIHG